MSAVIDPAQARPPSESYGLAERHQQRPQVGVAEPELPEVLGVLGDLLGRVGGVPDDDLLGQEHDLDRVPERARRRSARRREELEQVQAGQIAGRVVEVHVLRAVAHDDAVAPRRSGSAARSGCRSARCRRRHGSTRRDRAFVVVLSARSPHQRPAGRPCSDSIEADRARRTGRCRPRRSAGRSPAADCVGRSAPSLRGVGERARRRLARWRRCGYVIPNVDSSVCTPRSSSMRDGYRGRRSACPLPPGRRRMPSASNRPRRKAADDLWRRLLRSTTGHVLARPPSPRLSAERLEEQRRTPGGRGGAARCRWPAR